MFERIRAIIAATMVFCVLTIVGLFFVYLSYKLLQEGTVASQLFGGGIGLVGICLLAKVYRSLGRTAWAFAELENEIFRG